MSYTRRTIVLVSLIFLIRAKKELISDRALLEQEMIRRIHCSLGKENKDCPVNGRWSEWGAWGTCIGECGQVGLRKRTRICDNPKPLNGGRDCGGKFHEAVECHITGCSFKDYEELAKSDTVKRRELKLIRKVHENYPSLEMRCIKAECQMNVIQDVLGENSDRYWNAIRCVKHNIDCPVSGGWSDWGKWSDCSSWCGKGNQIKCRTCDNPIPTYHRLGCKGENCTTRSCDGMFCENVRGGRWTQWTKWTSCSSSCGQGLTKRKRTCVFEQLEKNTHFYEKNTTSLQHPYSNTTEMDSCRTFPTISHFYRRGRGVNSSQATLFCVGPHFEIKPCFSYDCPVNGEWSEWEPWTQCSVGCGLGLQSRSRACAFPAARHGGLPCQGPFTHFKHCFLQPCKRNTYVVARFTGDGSLEYLDKGMNTRLLHIYVKFKPLEADGIIILRKPTFGSMNQYHQIRLSLVSSYIVFIASVGDCLLSVISHQPLELNEWSTVLIMLTGHGVMMRVNDITVPQKGKFTCEPKLPNFRAYMTAGINFTGDIEKLNVNFKPRKLTLAPIEEKHARNIYPYSNGNVEYAKIDSGETYRCLSELLLVPCRHGRYWSLETVIKTSSGDGILMLIKDHQEDNFLVLSIEPRRIQLHFIFSGDFLQCYVAIEPHIGLWIHIRIDYNSDETYGLTVNGEQRRTLKKPQWIKELTCMDTIMIGDVVNALKLHLRNKEIKGLDYVSLSGLLAYIKLDNNDLDIDSLPAIVEKGEFPFSSETISTSLFYNEIELLPGDQLTISCLLSRLANSRNDWIMNQPVWLRFDVPLNASDKSFMEKIGMSYEIEDSTDITTLKILNYSSREAIEGYYSCWVPNSSALGNIIITYGVTILDPTTELSNVYRMFLMKMCLLFLVSLICILIWLLLEFLESLKSGWGIFSSNSIRKRIRKVELFELTHNHKLKQMLPINNKSIKKDKNNERRKKSYTQVVS